MKAKFLVPLVLLSGVGWQARAIAHGVVINYQATQAFEIKAAYDTGEPMAKAQVVVFSPGAPNEPWQTGTTDANGRFIFTPDQTGNWEVQVRQAGHGDIITILVETVSLANATNSVPAAPPSTIPEVVVPSTDTTSSAAVATTTTLTPLQKGLMIGSVVWGLIGTALFFSRSKKE